jgi:hypothetical protein
LATTNAVGHGVDEFSTLTPSTHAISAMSTYARLIGFAPCGLSQDALLELSAALRATHLAHLDVFELPSPYETATRFVERPAARPLVIDEGEAEDLLDEAALLTTGEERELGSTGFFEVHLLMKTAGHAGLPAAKGAFYEMCRIVAACVPRAHLWVGPCDEEYREFRHLSPWDIDRLPRLRWKGTGPGTPEGDRVLRLGNLVVMSAPPGLRT